MMNILLYTILILFSVAQVSAFAFGAPDYLPDASRPRVWITDASLVKLRAKAHLDADGNSTGGTPETEWTKFINAISPYRLNYAGYYNPQAWHFALAYMLTRDVEYANRAVELADAAIANMTDEISDSGLQAYRYAADVALVYDWLYSTLTTAQKANYKAYMLNWLNLIWNTSNANYNAWAKENPLNNYYWHHMGGTALIVSSLYGDDSSTLSLDISGVEYTSMMSFWNAKMLQAKTKLDIIGVGGGWQESHSYGQSAMEPMMWAFMAMKTASGKDWFNDLAFVKESALYLLYAEHNDASLNYAPFGDLTRDPKGSANQYSRIIRQFLSYALSGTSESEYMQYWSENFYTTISYTSLVPFNFLLRDSAKNATNHRTANLPKGYTAPGVGFFSWRSSWTDANTPVLMFNSGQQLESHQHPEHNAFTLWAYGDYLISDANLYESSGIAQYGELSNTIFVNGVQQYLPSTSAYSSSFAEGIVRSGYSDNYGYVKGDATSKYTSTERYDGSKLMDAVYRSIIQTGKYTFIYDKVSPKSATNNINYFLHAKTNPSISGNVVTITNAGGKAFHTSVLPSGINIVKGADSEIYSGCTGYYFKVTPTVPSTNHFFLSIIEVAPSTKSSPDATALIEGSGVTGVEVGGTVALFSTTQNADIVSATYTTNATTHYIADLPISANVEVFRDGVSIGTYNTGTAGIITFTAISGSADYTIGYPVAVEPTCSDGVQNGSETEVDCGGTCPACAQSLGKRYRYLSITDN